MDALALLCNLHADGPATARRLREAGCRTLRDIEQMNVEHLARVLGTLPAAARRFAQEGRLLAERAGGALLESLEEAPRTPAPHTHHTPSRPAPAIPPRATTAPPTLGAARTQPHPTAWSPMPTSEPEHDTARPFPAASFPQPTAFPPTGETAHFPPPPAGPRTAAHPPQAGPGTTPAGTTPDITSPFPPQRERRAPMPPPPDITSPFPPQEEAQARARTTPAGGPTPREFPSSSLDDQGLPRALGQAATGAVNPRAGCTPIEPGGIEGLDAVWCEDLRRAGIATLEELIGAEAIPLARQMDRPMTAVMNLQFLAESLIGGGRTGASTGSRTVTLAPRPPQRPHAQQREVMQETKENPSPERAANLPGISSLSASVHSVADLFPTSKTTREPSSGGPFA